MDAIKRWVVSLNQDFYTYSAQMQRYLEAQDERIVQLEKEIKRLTKEIAELNNRPPIHVDKIEYKFDQLKVESLDGTLNIGLNPSDLNNMDELSINKQPVPPVAPGPIPFAMRNQFVQEMSMRLLAELPSMIQNAETQIGISLDPSLHDFIRNDVEHQLPKRIDMYLNQSPVQVREPQQLEELKTNIYEKVKNDIKAALLQFISNYKPQTGGNHSNAT